MSTDFFKYTHILHNKSTLIAFIKPLHSIKPHFVTSFFKNYYTSNLADILYIVVYYKLYNNDHKRNHSEQWVKVKMEKFIK